MSALSEPSVRAWKPPIPGVREVLHATFPDHAYPPHTHDAWTLLIVDAGMVRYGLDRHERLADTSMVSVLPPHVVHDGRPARPGGYRKRVIYLEPDVFGDAMIGPSVDAPALIEPRLFADVAAMHDAIACVDDALEAETRLAFVAERIRSRFGVGEPSSAGEVRADVAEALRAYLDAHVFEPVTLAVASAAVGATPTQVTRAFAAAFGITPHAYLIGRRRDAARDRILGGAPLADVAAEVGFYDQAHLTHRFKRFLGITPGKFAR